MGGLAQAWPFSVVCSRVPSQAHEASCHDATTLPTAITDFCNLQVQHNSMWHSTIGIQLCASMTHAQLISSWCTPMASRGDLSVGVKKR